MPYQPVYYYPFAEEALPFLSIMVFAFGACIGSFLNVCIWRIPRNESIVFPPSHCPKCNYEIPWYENLPLVSWLYLQGKCHKCKTKISFRYFLIELLTAVMFFLIWVKVLAYQESLFTLIPYFAVTMLVITTIFIDCEHRIIPNETTYPVIILGLIFAIIYPDFWLVDNHHFTSPRVVAFARACGGLVVGFGSFAIFAVLGRLLFKKDVLGWGDVKYLGAIGATLGIMACVFTVLVGSLSGLLASIIMMFFRKKKKFRSTIAFGPYLAVGTYLWIIFPGIMIKIIIWYLNWLNSFVEK